MQAKKNDSAGILLLWLLLILAPVLGYGLLWIFTGTAPWKIDAWNSRWNDELGYLRGVRLIRTYLKPQGVIGYEEVVSSHLTYGPYTPFTYLIYVPFSLLTGITSHNFMYACNILMAVTANVIFVLLVRPEKKKAAWMAAFMLCNLIWVRHAWSGMVEESYSFYMVIFSGLVLYENERCEKEGKGPAVGIGAMIALTVYFSLMRPFYVLLLVFPLYYFIRRRKSLRRAGKGGGLLMTVTGCAVIAALIPAVLYAFIYLRNHYTAAFFSSSTNTVENFLNLLTGGDIGESARMIVSKNVDAIRGLVKNAARLPMPLVIFVMDLTEWAGLLLLLIRSLLEKKKDRYRIFTLLVYLLLSVAVYEATVVLYSEQFVHRMTEAVALGAGLILISYGRFSGKALAAVTLACSLTLGIRCPEAIAMPARSQRSLTQAGAEAVTRQYEQIMPRDESGDPWNNTIARPVLSTERFSDLYTLPDYLAMNIFRKDKLEAALKEGTLKSRYLMLGRGSDLQSLRLLAQEKYEVIGVFDYVEVFRKKE